MCYIKCLAFNYNYLNKIVFNILCTVVNPKSTLFGVSKTGHNMIQYIQQRKSTPRSITTKHLAFKTLTTCQAFQTVFIN